MLRALEPATSPYDPREATYHIPLAIDPSGDEHDGIEFTVEVWVAEGPCVSHTMNYEVHKDGGLSQDTQKLHELIAAKIGEDSQYVEARACELWNSGH